MTSGEELPEVEFARLLAWAYRGEVSGEALFATLADAWPDNAGDLRVLAELERHMANALVPLLARYDVEGGNDERSRRTGRDSAAGLAEQGWPAFLTLFVPVTDAALERYHRLQTLAPETDPRFDALIAHEEALQAFGVAHLAGAGDHALDPVREVIARLSTAGTASA